MTPLKAFLALEGALGSGSSVRQLRDAFRNKNGMGIFSTKYRFFLKMSQSEKFKKKIVNVLAPQDHFGMQKKLGKQT